MQTLAQRSAYAVTDTPPATRPIPGAMNDLSNAIERLQAAANALADRCSLVLAGGSVGGESGQTPGQPTPVRSPVADAIHQAIVRLNATSERLEMLEARVEI